VLEGRLGQTRIEKRGCAIESSERRAVIEIGELSTRDLFILGIGLYWGEGVKSRSGMAALVNSDPEVIKLGKQWFEVCLSVPADQFRPYIYLSEMHYSRRARIVDFWSRELGLCRDQFKVIILKSKPKKVYTNHDTYYGVLSLRVAKSTNLKYRIQGLIKACKQTGKYV
jgi:hypothetical protein